MDINSSSQQLINQIFGHQQMIDDTSSQLIACNRNQYREVERFDTEDDLQDWMMAQGKQWGIVQKGRVTIEDIIDQYACVYRRRKGYSCKVQMRVRHNRRNGHKVVEVLELDHDHTFYGYKNGSETSGEAKLFPPPSTTSNNQFSPQINDFASSDHHSHQHMAQYVSSNINLGHEHNGTDQQDESELYNRMLKLGQQQQFDFSTLLPAEEEERAESDDHLLQNGGRMVGEEDQDEDGETGLSPLNIRPMEMLLSNILNNAHNQQHQSNGGATLEEGFEGSGGGFGGLEGQELSTMVEQFQQQQQQNEALAERVAEKMVNFLTSQLEPKFASILCTLTALNKSVDELKRSVAVQQQQQNPRLFPLPPNSKTNNFNNKSPNSNGTSAPVPPSKIAFRPFAQLNNRCQQILQNSTQKSNFVHSMPKLSAQLQHSNSNRASAHSNNDSTGNTSAQLQNPLAPNRSSLVKHFTASLPTLSLAASDKDTALSLAANVCPPPFSSSAPSIAWARKRPSPSTPAAVPSKSPSKIGPSIAKNLPRRTARKSLFAYRQRRRELSYRHMKEIGLTLTINGTQSSIFHCRVTDISAAVQAKRRELAQAGKKVFYRGHDVTDKLYRVDCSRVLVNGRRCGQMIADSLWPRGFFRQRMLMPILRGVSHRTKRRVDGSMREAVANDQFEVFKEALFRLGGFLIEEPDRYKWMETAREGVNQRGLDELANSKRAHFEFEGGPLFGEEVALMDLDNAGSQRNFVTAYSSAMDELSKNILSLNDRNRRSSDGEERMDEGKMGGEKSGDSEEVVELLEDDEGWEGEELEKREGAEE